MKEAIADRLQLSENATRVIQVRYLRRNALGQVIETPDQLFARVAKAVSEAESLYGPAGEARLWEERYYQMLASLDFLPNSPTLMNAGTQPCIDEESYEREHFAKCDPGACRL